ncbi:MAG: riboflavin synthase [Alphaproteobacteria bacterium]|jgi:riboflavin synthase|nr:riboflavin synthase [Alphaproteobacteria bacterium]MBT7942326.1 riboflavin synthase [Alphaproteobacteria bacterium]
MFTGIITDLGRVRAVIPDGDTRFEFSTGFDTYAIDIGASICCSGVCLTVIDKGQGEGGDNWFAADASAETLGLTTMGDWTEGTRVNFERALKMGDELGGHIVSGHVDGIATLNNVTPEGESRRMTFEAPESLSRMIAAKGSVTLDGVSLTVNHVDGLTFGVNIIPHTLQATTLGSLQPGDRVNLEIDMLARYVARLVQPD